MILFFNDCFSQQCKLKKAILNQPDVSPGRSTDTVQDGQKHEQQTDRSVFHHSIARPATPTHAGTEPTEPIRAETEVNQEPKLPGRLRVSTLLISPSI